METFSTLLALREGNSPVPVNFLDKGQRCGTLMFSLISACINDGVNNHVAGDLRRHRGHYNVNNDIHPLHSPIVYAQLSHDHTHFINDSVRTRRMYFSATCGIVDLHRLINRVRSSYIVPGTQSRSHIARLQMFSEFKFWPLPHLGICAAVWNICPLWLSSVA